MIVCIDESKRVLWLNDDDSIKNESDYIFDDNVFIINKQLSFPSVPKDSKKYMFLWDFETEDILLVQILTEKDIIENIDNVSTQTSIDTLSVIELGLSTDNKVAMTQEDALLILEMLISIQQQLNKNNIIE